MEHGLLLLVLAGAGAFFMAFNNGANDVANSFASAVGARAISMQQAVLIAGMMNLLGAVLIGGNVSAKLVTGVLNPHEFADPTSYVVAMFSVLVAAGCFVLLSTLASIPVSSSHSIVGSLIGVSLAAGGIETVNWGELQRIVLSWLVSPVLAGAMSFGLLTFIQRAILGGSRGPMDRLRFYLPYVVALTIGVFVLILMKGSVLSAYKPGSVWELLLFMAVLLPYTTLVAQGLLRSFTLNLPDDEGSAELVFRRLQVGTSSYVAFAHGANDVANAISPVFAVYLVVRAQGALPTAELVEAVGVPLWILVLGGAGIAAGIGLLGHRVIRTLSERITRIDNFKGFSVDFSAATTVVTASLLGLPVSSTHAATGAIVGTGLREGQGVDLAVLGRIVVAWVLTVPAAGIFTVTLYLALRAVAF
ncbi:MAG TPA: anion permease [Polyangiaceae bacterium LLY-WYZ-14_1]|nr:anion permease [Polyangiaceae bacterium LLY-WYZ-14_1]